MRTSLRREAWLSRARRTSGIPPIFAPTWSLAPTDDLDPVVVRIADETEPRTALAHLVRRALGLDALLGQACQRAVEVVDADRDMAVTGADIVAPAVVI